MSDYYILPKIESDRVKSGLCIKCKKDTPIKDLSIGLLCPKCRKEYDEESEDWKSIVQDVLY